MPVLYPYKENSGWLQFPSQRCQYFQTALTCFITVTFILLLPCSLLQDPTDASSSSSSSSPSILTLLPVAESRRSRERKRGARTIAFSIMGYFIFNVNRCNVSILALVTLRTQNCRLEVGSIFRTCIKVAEDVYLDRIKDISSIN